MKLSLQTVLFIVLLVNLFLGGLRLAETMVQSSEEEARMTGTPMDWRYRQPRHHEVNAAPADPAIVATASLP